MRQKIRRLPDSELELMRIIWRCEPPASRTDIERGIEKHKSPAATTILTFLSRLCDKGFLTVEKRGKSNYYTPTVSEKEYLASQTRDILDRLYGGSLTAFAAALCDSGVSRREVEELHALLERNAL